MTPLEYCRDKAAPPGSSLHYAIYFADRSKQPALYALYGYHAELVEISRKISDRGVAAAKLGWWREELARAFQGTGQHPVSQALHEHALTRFDLPRDDFEQVIEGVAMDLEYGLYPSFKQLSLYCHRIGGAVTRLAVNVCGYSDTRTTRFAHDLGMGLQLAELLHDFRPHLDAGRVYIPEDELQQAGVSQAELLRAQDSDRARALFGKQARRIEDFFDSALAHLPEQDRARQRPALILIELYRTLIREMAAEDYPLLKRRVFLTPIRKLWIAWRTARRAKA